MTARRRARSKAPATLTTPQALRAWLARIDNPHGKGWEPRALLLPYGVAPGDSDAGVAWGIAIRPYLFKRSQTDRPGVGTHISGFLVAVPCTSRSEFEATWRAFQSTTQAEAWEGRRSTRRGRNAPPPTPTPAIPGPRRIVWEE